MLKEHNAANLITEPVKGDAVQCTHDQYNKIFGDVYNDFKTVIELSKCVEKVQEHCHSFIKILEDLHRPAETAEKIQMQSCQLYLVK